MSHCSFLRRRPLTALVPLRAGEKLAVAAVRHYLLVATPEEGDASSGAAGAAGSSGGGQGQPVQVRAFDLANKVVAASASLDGPLAWLAAAPGGGLVAFGNGEGVVRLRERPLGEKLETLYKARAFQLALAVAETEKVRSVGFAICWLGQLASWGLWGG